MVSKNGDNEWRVGGVIGGVIGLCLNVGGYGCEIIGGGILCIGKGEREGGYCIGMKYR
ncbi:hypothetical protein [Staphylococcus epidermidis]|uniref:hypothetical protein n=1 Tax=Staphylococcus epidermidis TaxID=1282 RepID=UPI001643474F|nr:hypothetical protein [Staphylococcus epidermidis]